MACRRFYAPFLLSAWKISPKLRRFTVLFFRCMVYCKGKIRTTPFRRGKAYLTGDSAKPNAAPYMLAAPLFRNSLSRISETAAVIRLFAHLPCNTRVLLRHLHKNLAQKSSRQRCNAIKSGKTCVSDEVRSALCASARCAVRALRTKKSRFQQRFRARGGTLHWCRREKGAGRAVWHGQAFQQCMSAAVSAFDRVRITPLQYNKQGGFPSVSIASYREKEF